jgi:hypothetical protein
VGGVPLAPGGGEAMAVNEQTGDIVQVSEGGYTGMLNLARKSMKLYFMRKAPTPACRSSKSTWARASPTARPPGA